MRVCQILFAQATLKGTVAAESAFDAAPRVHRLPDSDKLLTGATESEQTLKNIMRKVSGE
jgi:hypothetical protein